MKEYIKLIRPTNILFIILIMLLYRFAFILPTFYDIYNFEPALNNLEYIILILITTITAASGYIINDIYDSDIDLINKPQKVIIDKSIAVDDAYNFYKILCLISTLLTITLAILTNNYKLATLPIIILVALNFYAQFFKKQFIIGNLIIAVFAALVILLPALYESSTLTDDITINQIKSGIFAAGLCYATFAFLSTWLREIVKDMQDIEGDKAFACQTIPIKLGIFKTKIINSIIIQLIATFIVSFTLFFPTIDVLYLNIYIYTLLLFPLIFILIINWWSKSKKQFQVFGNLIKIYMLIGVCTMIYFIYASGTGSYIFMQYFSFIKKII
jgi:4-hydroxybenzoate polyprenyltransferase